MKHTVADYSIFLFISTLVAQIHPITRPVSALRKHLRKVMAARNKAEYDETMAIAKSANIIWKEIQDDLNSNTRVTTISSLNSMYALMSKDQQLIPEKKFESAIRSIYEASRLRNNPDEVANNDNARTISNAMAKALGIKQDNSLSRLRNKVRNETILATGVDYDKPEITTQSM